MPADGSINIGSLRREGREVGKAVRGFGKGEIPFLASSALPSPRYFLHVGHDCYEIYFPFI